MDLKRVAVLGALLGCAPPPPPGSTPQSSTVTVAPGGLIVVIDADHGGVAFINPKDMSTQRLAVCDEPAQLTMAGDLLLVSCRYSRSVAVVSLATRTVLHTVEVGTEPYGVVHMGPSLAAVVTEGDRAVVLFDPVSAQVMDRIPLELKWPRGVAALSPVRLVITDLVDARVVEVDVVTRGQVIHDVTTPAPERGVGGLGTLMHSVTSLGPGRGYLVPHAEVVKSSAPGLFAFPGPIPSSVYYGPKEAPRATAFIHFVTDDQPRTHMLGSPPAPGVLNPKPVVREPVVVAELDGGAMLAVLFRANRLLQFWPVNHTSQGPDTQCSNPLAVVEVGHGADGLALHGRQVIVHNAFDLTINVVDIPVPIQFGCVGLPPPAPDTYSYGPSPLAEAVQAGRRLFHDATDPAMSNSGVTCAFCHVDGRADGRTWNAPKGLRNTPSLAGAGPDRTGIASTTLPLHWDGEFTTFSDMNTTVRAVMGGSGISNAQAGELGAYIDTLRAPDAPPPSDEDKEQVELGRRLFHDPVVGCATCHMGEHGTDNLNHDVGLGSMQTPVLHGLARTAPYMHDGSAETLRDVLADYVLRNRMGRGTYLKDYEVDALEAYLLTR
ncbi:MAG: cytochrome c peroxidase [Myxococcota bacterium]